MSTRSKASRFNIQPSTSGLRSVQGSQASIPTGLRSVQVSVANFNPRSQPSFLSGGFESNTFLAMQPPAANPSQLGPQGGPSMTPSQMQQQQQMMQPQVPQMPDLEKFEGSTDYGTCGQILIFFSYLLCILTFPVSWISCMQMVQEYERAVIFRLGRILPGGAKGPGLFYVLPCTDEFRKVDLRLVAFDIPPQEILSLDSVTVSVDAIIYFKVTNPVIAICAVENATRSTQLLASSSLRNTLGTKTLSDILSKRDVISHEMQGFLDLATDPWGIRVERVEIKDVRLPSSMQRAMAAEAEATREAKAKIISAEGEQMASKALKEAADMMAGSNAALQLRYLQTLNTISAERNSTIVFPVPMNLLNKF